jgi:hypothetical protein
MHRVKGADESSPVLLQGSWKPLLTCSRRGLFASSKRLGTQQTKNNSEAHPRQRGAVSNVGVSASNVRFPKPDTSEISVRRAKTHYSSVMRQKSRCPSTHPSHHDEIRLSTGPARLSDSVLQRKKYAHFQNKDRRLKFASQRFHVYTHHSPKVSPAKHQAKEKLALHHNGRFRRSALGSAAFLRCRFPIARHA